MSSFRLFALLLGLVFALLTGCDAASPIACPASIEPAVVVDVDSAGTDVPAAANATGTLRDGAYTDTMRVRATTDERVPLTLAGGFERAGVYDVRIEKAGFQPWTRSDVVVESGRCGPKTRQLTAGLVPASDASNR